MASKVLKKTKAIGGAALTTVRKGFSGFFKLTGFAQHGVRLPNLMIWAFTAIATIVGACVSGKGSYDGLREEEKKIPDEADDSNTSSTSLTPPPDDPAESDNESDSKLLEEKESNAPVPNSWESRGKKFGWFAAVINTFVFSAMSGYGAYFIFMHACLPLLITAIVLFTFAGFIASWYFAKQKIENTFASCGKYLDNKNASTPLSTIAKFIFIAVLNLVTAPLFVLSLEVPLMALFSFFMNASLAAILAYSIAGTLVFFALFASIGLIYAQMEKTKILTISCQKAHRENQAKGFYVKLLLGVVFSLVSSGIAAAGDFFGMHALYPSLITATVFGILSLLYNLCYSLADTTINTIGTCDRVSDIYCSLFGNKMRADSFASDNQPILDSPHTPSL